MRRLWIGFHGGLAFAVMAIAVIGCDAEPHYGDMRLSRGDLSPSEPPAIPAAPAHKADMPAEYATRGKAVDSSETADVTKTQESATAGRKIIYTGQVDLVTEDLNVLESKLTQLITAQKAYVADSERTGSAGAMRRGSWKVRVPVDAYDPFVKGVVALGELVTLKADSQDVSEEFFDLDARQAAKKVEEQRLLKHLTESTGKLEDILAVERELSRVRTEIERMQGRLRALANLTTLATVTITASEIKGYVPPQAPTLGTRIARTFAASVESLREFGEGLLIFVVAIVPWLPLIALIVGFVVWIARRSMARYPASALIDVPPPPTRRG